MGASRATECERRPEQAAPAATPLSAHGRLSVLSLDTRLTGRLRRRGLPPACLAFDRVEQARTVRGIRETVILEAPPPVGKDR